MLIKENKLRAFCRGLVNSIEAPMYLPKNEEELARISYFNHWALVYEELAMAAFDLGFGLGVTRQLLAQSAWAYVTLQRYRGEPSAPDALQVLFRIGTCHDAQAASAFCAAYLETPEGRRGEFCSRGFASPAPDDHFWHFVNVLALFHVGDPAALPGALDELQSLPPRKQWKHSDTWFKAMTRLAVHCLSVSAPDPSDLLAEVAAINQKMFARDAEDLFYEAWFAERTMSFACAAQQRGWVVPDRDPHPSMPLALLRLPPMPVPDYPWDQPPPPDPELVRAIARVARGLSPRRAPAAPKTAARKPARKSAGVRKAARRSSKGGG